MTNIKQFIEVKPTLCHGQPCFRGTRILVYLVLELLEAGESPSDIITKAYPQLTKKHIQAALHYAAQIMKSGDYFAFANA